MAAPASFAFFPTALGTCAIAWNDVGLTGVWLPDAEAAALRRKVARRCIGAAEAEPTGAAADLVEAITRLLAGQHVDLSAVVLDSSGVDAFDCRVYEVTRTIAAGRVMTYGEVASLLGPDVSARAVGQALGRNAMPIVVPCHRVVASGGLGGFSAPGGASTKRRMLAIEDARPTGPPGLFDTAESRRDDALGFSGRETGPRH